MRALVTGACGFVGKHLVRHLLDSGDEVVGTYLGPKPDPIEGARLLPLDITDRDACSRLLNSEKPEVIYHLAGISFVPEAEADFGRTLQVNVTGAVNLCRAEATFVFASSSEVYGQAEALPIEETAPLRPANAYSLSKMFAEAALARYAKRLVILRPFNHLGPGQSDRFAASTFARQLAAIARGQAEPVLKVGNLEAVRDFSDVRDVVRGYRLAALRREGVFNLCSGRGVPVADLLHGLIEASGLNVEIVQDPERMRPAEVPFFYGSFRLAKESLGWEPTITLDATLRDVYRDALR